MTAASVWTYWEGPCPELIRMCIESLQRFAGAQVLDRTSFDELWKADRDVPIDDLYVAHRADFIRAYLLRYYGGTWIDADCVAVRELRPLLDIGDKDLGVYRQKVGGVSNNFIVGHAGSPTVVRYYEQVAEHVRARRPINWTEIGSVPLARAILERRRRTHEFDRMAISPFCWTEINEYLVPCSGEAQAATSTDERTYCHMLSNHSLPAYMKTMTRSELVCAPNRLGAVLRRSLRKEPFAMTQAPNYDYWRSSGGVWHEEYERRKKRHPYYHIAEIMLLDYAIHHAPCRMLEWGCGTGRHIVNLSQVPGVEIHGFDQSAAMVDSGVGRSHPELRRERIVIGDPTGRLPYADGEFDIVFTSEALLHTRPEDLPSRLAEIRRVSRGQILHLEAPPEWAGGFSPWCDGCWGHDFVGVYHSLGLECEVLPSGFTRQVPYRVVPSPGSVHWTWPDAMLGAYRRLEAALESGFGAAGVPAHA